MGATAMGRVSKLLKLLDNVRRSEDQDFTPKAKANETSNKFIGTIESIFADLPRPREWLSFFHNDLPLAKAPEDVKQMHDANGLNASQTRAVLKVNATWARMSCCRV